MGRIPPGSFFLPAAPAIPAGGSPCLWLMDEALKLYRVEAPPPRQFVAGVLVNHHGRIVHTAPILSRFLGRPIAELLAWRRVRVTESELISPAR